MSKKLDAVTECSANILQRLRERAESAVQLRAVSEQNAGKPPRDLERELEVHRLELEMQNEQLRETQACLEHSLACYRGLFELAPVGHLVLAGSGVILELNDVAARLLGRHRDSLRGRTLLGLVSEDDATHCLRALREACAKVGARQSVQVSLNPSSPGDAVTALQLELQVAPQTHQCHCVMLDLSELRGAQRQCAESEARGAELERRCRESEALSAQIAEYVPDAFVIHDRSTQGVIYANPAFETIWGRPVTELMARPGVWLDWMHPDDRARLKRAYADMLEGEPLDEECRVVHPDGEVRWVHLRSFPIPDDDGQVRRDIGVAQDVTEEKALEAQLRQAQKMTALGGLASGVAHDFNNVLQAILGCVRVAQHEATSPAVAREQLERAAAAARRGGNLSKRLMAFSRPCEDEPRALSVDQCVQGVAGLIDRLVTEQIILRVDTRAPDCVVGAEASDLEHVLMNLAANARDAMPHGGTLSIRTEVIDAEDGPAVLRTRGAADGYACITVQDTGVGMDEVTRQRAFEPFFTTKEVGKGTGLGLASVFAVMRQMRGCVEVDSRPGAGTTFRLYVPIDSRKAVVPGAVAQSVAPGRLEGTVLLVEDDPDVRSGLRIHLERLGLNVWEGASLEEAKAAVTAGDGHVDLLISDVMLPGGIGTCVVEWQRARNPSLPVVLITANPGEVELPPNATALRKPFDPCELNDVLVRLLAAPRSLHVQTVEAADNDQQTAPAGSGQRPTILLVEDEDDSRQALAELLEHQGYRVLQAATASEALQAAERRDPPPSVLVTDVRLPCMQGPDLVRRLRRAWPGLRVVYVSGQSDMPSGADACLVKPIELRELNQVVERLLQHG